jgi:hypothetical protein
MVSGANTPGTHAEAATARASSILQSLVRLCHPHSSRGTLSASWCTAQGDSPIHVGVNCQAWPVFTVVELMTSTGTLCARNQLCLPG